LKGIPKQPGHLRRKLLTKEPQNCKYQDKRERLKHVSRVKQTKPALLMIYENNWIKKYEHKLAGLLASFEVLRETMRSADTTTTSKKINK